MIVYIEYVLLDNIFIDYSLLKATFLVMGKSTRKCRLFLSSFLGGIVALVFPLINFNLIFVGVLKLFSGLLIVLVANSYKRLKEYYLCCIVFILFTFALGGIIIGAFSIFELSYGSELSIAIMFFPAYLFIHLFYSFFRFIKDRGKMQSSYCYVTIFNGEREIKLNGLMDTGNSLMYNNEPVVVINKIDALKIFSIFDFKKVILLKYATASGVGEMKILKVNKLSFTYDKNDYIIENIYCGIGNVKSGCIILNPTILSKININNSK